MPPPDSLVTRTPPPGFLLISGRRWKIKTYRYMVLLVTFIAYVCFHASRKPTGIVKSVLYPEPNKGHITHQHKPWPVGAVFVKDQGIDVGKKKTEGWAPFNETDGTSKLGEIDVAFLACYSVGMYVSGHLGDTLDLRLFLTMGMLGSGVFVGLFGKKVGLSSSLNS